MIEAPKRIHDTDWDVWYVRADIADVWKAQRGVHIAPLVVAARDMEKHVDMRGGPVANIENWARKLRQLNEGLRSALEGIPGWQAESWEV